MKDTIRLHNPEISTRVHLALKLIAVRHGVTLQALVEHIITSSPLVKAELKAQGADPLAPD